MSGDVQPRKRKDKKRKKDDTTTEQIPTQPQTPPSSNQNEDINIHVHKDDGTGGGICAKIIFFLLFSALAILIGLIITEHRGLTDLDTVDQESRFSQLFEGWTDKSRDEHEDEDHLISSLEEEDHGDQVEEASPETHDVEEEEHEADEDELEEASDEVAQSEEEDEEEEAEQSEEAPLSEEEDEEEEEEEEEEDEETAEEDDEEPNMSEVEDEPNVSEVDDEDDNESEAQDADDDDNEVSEENEPDVSKEVEQSVEDEDQADEDEDRIVSKEETDDVDEVENVPEQSEEKGSEEIKDEEPQLSKEVEEEQPEEEKEAEAGKENEEQQNSKMVVKIGVGVALLVVAHVVLVRKWKSATPPSESPKKDDSLPDLSRRNTIVAPPTFQEVEPDIEDVEEEYSDEDGEVESDEDRREGKSAKLRYQELRTTYTRSLTPDSEPEYQNKATDPDDEEYEDEEDEEEVDDEEEEEESDTGEYEKEDEDEELLKRLEARYGKLRGDNEEVGKEDEDEQFSSWKRVNVGGDNEAEESDSDRQSDVETYEYENITSKDDLKLKEKLDEAHKNIHNNTAYAIKLFDVLLQNYPSSPRSLYGKAQALDILADRKRSNDILQKALSIYLQVLNLENVPDTLFEIAAERCINRMRFMGNYKGCIDVHNKLINRFPEETKYRNQLVVTYLTINRVNKARILLQEILSKDPDDGFALVHFGFILKTVDNKLNESVSYLQKGISSKAPGVIDGRFYFHLGDALTRLGKTDEAMQVYDDGVKHNLFLSKYQRSLYNVDRLKGQPWWKKQETPYANLYTALENNWKKIREEGISVLNKNGQFQSESENLKDTGDWKQFELFARGQRNVNNCNKCPVTCKIIESIPDARGCRRGQTKFSVMHPGTHVWPHCGPTNCRLRVHLGLKVPPHTYIRVADEVRSWNDGEVLIFDDSFEHEVWHNGTSFRLVLIVDVWHPELTAVEKRTLSPI